MAFKDRVKERVAAREEKADRGKGQPIPWTPFPNGFPGAGNKKTSEPSKAEKDKALIGEGPGALDKVYGAVAAPLPPAKLNVDKIEGDTVREKWVNFLLAETGDEET